MDVIDLNCDMGESFGAWTMGSDAEMLKIVSSANVACGFHGGDPLVMFETVTRAKENGVGIGAHPSFFDIWGFGRRQIQGEKPEDRLRTQSRLPRVLRFRFPCVVLRVLCVGMLIFNIPYMGGICR